jgi:hypothetical protein
MRNKTNYQKLPGLHELLDPEIVLYKCNQVAFLNANSCEVNAHKKRVEAHAHKRVNL